MRKTTKLGDELMLTARTCGASLTVCELMDKASQEIEKLVALLAPLQEIAARYHEEGLDEARPSWTEKDSLHPKDLAETELFQGRGGKQLLTLGQCFAVEEAFKQMGVL